MNKEYIEGLLREEEMVNLISKLRTQFSVFIYENNFFKIFFEALSTLNIKGNLDYDTNLNGFNVIIDQYVMDYYISLSENDKEYRFPFDSIKLNKDLVKFNETQSGMGMISSTHALIDIFVNLLQ